MLDPSLRPSPASARSSGFAHRQSTGLSPQPETKSRRRGEHLETLLLVLIAVALFSACLVVAFGTVAVARTASTSIDLPVDEGLPAADDEG